MNTFVAYPAHKTPRYMSGVSLTSSTPCLLFLRQKHACFMFMFPRLSWWRYLIDSFPTSGASFSWTQRRLLGTGQSDKMLSLWLIYIALSGYTSSFSNGNLYLTHTHTHTQTDRHTHTQTHILFISVQTVLRLSCISVYDQAVINVWKLHKHTVVALVYVCVCVYVHLPACVCVSVF